MKMLAKVKKSVVVARKNLNDNYNEMISKMKDKAVDMIIASGKDGDKVAK